MSRVIIYADGWSNDGSVPNLNQVAALYSVALGQAGIMADIHIGNHGTGEPYEVFADDEETACAIEQAVNDADVSHCYEV